MCFEQNNTLPFQELTARTLALDYRNRVFEFVYGTFQLFSGVYLKTFPSIKTPTQVRYLTLNIHVDENPVRSYSKLWETIFCFSF